MGPRSGAWQASYALWRYRWVAAGGVAWGWLNACRRQEEEMAEAALLRAM